MTGALLALLPPLVAAALLLGTRAGLASASLAALGAALPALLAAMPLAALPGFVWRETLAGAFLAFVPCSVMAAGLWFHAVASEGGAEGGTLGEASRHRRLFLLCFLLAPVAESATGFGVGQLAAASGLARLGVVGAPGVALGLMSQMLVPWGALAVAPVAMAGLLGLDRAAFGSATAWLMAPVLFVTLGLFWRLLARAGERVTAADRVEDAAWVAALALLLLLVQGWPGIEVAGIAAPGLLVCLHLVRDGTARALLRRGLPGESGPYLVLCLVLLASRGIEPLRRAIAALWAWAPYPDLPAIAPLYLPTVPILAVGLGLALWRGRPDAASRALLRARRGWRPILATLAFVVLARWLMAAGSAASAGASLHDVFGSSAVLAGPVLGAAVCWLTGSNTGSLAMLGPVMAGIGEQAGLDPVWAPAALNAAGTFCLASTVRVGMGIGLGGAPVAPRQVYRELGPWLVGALAALLVGTGVVLLRRG